MKKMTLWAWACMLIIFIGVTGTSCSREQAKLQGKEQIKEKAQERSVPPQAEEGAPEKMMPLPDHGKTAETPEKAGQISSGIRNAPIARVNGTDITMNELASEMKMIGPQFMKDAGQKTPENVRKLKQMAFDILIFRELATQEAARQGMKVRREAVEEADKQLRASLGSEDNYKKFLEMSGYTGRSMRTRFEKDMLFEMITDKEIFKKVGANDQTAIEKRKEAWENSLKKNAKIEIFLPEVEKKIREEAKNRNSYQR